MFSAAPSSFVGPMVLFYGFHGAAPARRLNAGSGGGVPIFSTEHGLLKGGMAASSLTSGPQPAPNARGQGLLFQGAKPYAAGVAGVAELVDALDLGSSAARRGGSSPLARTNHQTDGAGFGAPTVSWFRTW